MIILLSSSPDVSFSSPVMVLGPTVSAQMHAEEGARFSVGTIALLPSASAAVALGLTATVAVLSPSSSAGVGLGLSITAVELLPLITAELAVTAEAIQDVKLYLYTNKQALQDVKTYLYTSSGDVLQDVNTYLYTTDGIVLQDIRLSLRVIKKNPVYKTTIAQRLRSIVSEV